MLRVFPILILLCLVSNALADEPVVFVAVDVYIESQQPLAAWQFELTDRQGVMKVVGVESGESAAFKRVPYYDREAVRLGQADRIIVADYSLAAATELPSGRVRIATIHLMLDADAADDLKTTLITATAEDGRVIDASIELTMRNRER